MNDISKNLEDFLAFAKDAQTNYNMGVSMLDESNLELQDLEHYMEFGSPSAIGMVKSYKKFQEISQKRRIAKETIELYLPVVEWLEGNSKTIHELQALLGSVRKIESRQGSRSYYIRTKVLEGITDEERLYSKGGLG